MIAYHFPPLAGSSGIQRTLRFVQHLPSLGWEPIVLTADPRAYDRVSDDLVNDIPQETVVKRAFALDASRHLALFGRYPGFLARPDRWRIWQWAAVPAGLSLVRRYQPAALWSTYPIATAHLIGAALNARTGLPWIADFRDPMAQDGYPTDPKTWRSYKSIEERTLRNAARSVFSAPGAARLYRERYGGVAGEQRITVIENGYDEESFAELAVAGAAPLNPGKVTLLHSGIIYPSERDPTQFLRALRILLDARGLREDAVCIRLRAAVHEDLLRALIKEYRLEPLVELAPPIPYRMALEEMMRAEGLIVLQASNCNEQIPAKLYEYLRARRPIIGLTDPAGDTAGVLRSAGMDAIAPLHSAERIADAMEAFLARLRTRSSVVVDASFVGRASRRCRAQELASLLDEIC
ncbi:MAG: glycosyltransferase [Gammaproteobacteria bacterium]